MRISLIVIGKTSTPWLKQGIDEYVKRLARYAPFQYVELPDVKLRNARITQDQLKAAEAPVVPQSHRRCRPRGPARRTRQAAAQRGTRTVD